MAATATNTPTAREDAPVAPEDRVTTAPPGPDQTDAPAAGFDALFVQPVDPHDGRGSLPSLPGRWRHAGLVRLVARQPRERRETILAGGFALVAVLWAPLGMLAFMTRNGLLFGVLSVAAAVVAVVPRPVTVSAVVGDLVDRVRPALARIAPAIASTRQRLAPLAGRLQEGLGERLAPLVPRLRDASERAGASLRRGGHRLAARLRSADRSVSAAVRNGLEGLQSRGGRDHSTPSSAR